MAKHQYSELLRIGSEFRKWAVVGRIERRKVGSQGKKYKFVRVRCVCGTERVFLVWYLVNGTNKQCRTCDAEEKRTHGKSGTGLYVVWTGMLLRCYNTTAENYKRYGGRGIRVCKEWREDFLAFEKWAIEEGWKPGLQIDRCNNAKGYSRGNCQFVTAKQNANNRRSSRWETAFGETKTLAQWADDKRCRVSYVTLHYRVTHGWTITDAILKPKLGGG